MQLSIVSHYYNNVSAVEKMIASFAQMERDFPDYFDFVLVDDHSHKPVPLNMFEGLRNLRVFRIKEDVAWNMPAARNIGVHEARCEKIVLLDIDHGFHRDDTRSLMLDAERLQQNEIGHFPRMKKEKGGWVEINPHINSFLICRSDFMRVGGYDESFSGSYGCEDKFFQVCCRKNGIKRKLMSTMAFVVASATQDLDRDKSINQTILERLMSKPVPRAEKFMTYSWEKIHPKSELSVSA
ncbi:glycosyltransferase family 2 protein [Roseicyclus persicicus]|uniref:Glycosyltransferase n=1 Tax=Roseicyclus persicicus TaxID=2650661 RepID=A0A7X6GZM8_9RHOB|nr:glycosyltransferase [Roseibacterium persicicum]NKX45336.1 glycosyltransferase [Roseibacterium persicicum]